MTKRQKRMLALAVLVTGVGLAATLTLTAFRKNLMSFYTPSDLTAAVTPGTKLRLGGVVERGSLRRGEGLRIEFFVADCSARVPVRYEGILPDLFREGQGVVASGELGDDRVFVANEVLAKHDENYMPPQVAGSMQTPEGHACQPFKPVHKEGA